MILAQVSTSTQFQYLVLIVQLPFVYFHKHDRVSIKWAFRVHSSEKFDKLQSVKPERLASINLSASFCFDNQTSYVKMSSLDRDSSGFLCPIELKHIPLS